MSRRKEVERGLNSEGKVSASVRMGPDQGKHCQLSKGLIGVNVLGEMLSTRSNHLYANPNKQKGIID